MLTTRLRGARAHNLKGIDLELVPGELVVLTGVSGSGKSSLALDTLYAEGQRRFVESFSPYARQFLERLERPAMDELEPVPAAVAVDRSAPVKSSRSTVATMADIEPYLAALFARESLPVCPEHGLTAQRLDIESALDRALAVGAGRRALVSYSLRVSDAESYLEVRERLAGEGYRRLWLGGATRSIDDVRPTEVSAVGEVEVVLDRLRLLDGERKRLAAGLESAWQRAEGHARLRTLEGEPLELELIRGASCPQCSRVLDPAKPGHFSYDSPLGACPECRGFGRIIGVDLDKVIPDPRKTLKGKTIRPWAGKSTTRERSALKRFCEQHEIPMGVPWAELLPGHRELIIRGEAGRARSRYPGIAGWFRWLEGRTYKMHVRVLLARYRSYERCPSCDGRRLNPTALSYSVAGRNLGDFHRLEISEVGKLLTDYRCSDAQAEVARQELVQRLDYLERAGLGYLTLERMARSLSAGEAQRVTLTAALGTSLCNALFVLDEPTIGLHAADVAPLCQMLRELAARGNSVVVVEHDPQVIATADRVLELGPGPGSEGGVLVQDGSPAQLLRKKRSATAQAFAGLERPRVPRTPSGWLELSDVSANNLKHVDVRLPLGLVTAVTGPSGSGKSSLVVDVVYRVLARHFGALDVPVPGAHEKLEGLEQLRQVVLVDQSPLGRTSRGNAATYTKAWDRLRTMLAREPAAQARGFTPSHFSFNVDGGRCPDCKGDGHETVEMQFLADVRLICPVCRGSRFRPEVLEVTLRGWSVADLLGRTVEEVLERFADVPQIQRTLTPVVRLGLGYLGLGQSLSTLSGGEAQRLKLARALREDLRSALLVLDEPSAGLHVTEVAYLLDALDLAVRAGASVLLVEHDLDVVRAADWVVEMGPGPGSAGGSVVATGSPAQLAKLDVATGRALSHPPVVRPGRRAKPKVGAQTLDVVRAREHNLKDVRRPTLLSPS